MRKLILFWLLFLSSNFAFAENAHCPKLIKCKHLKPGQESYCDPLTPGIWVGGLIGYGGDPLEGVYKLTVVMSSTGKHVSCGYSPTFHSRHFSVINISFTGKYEANQEGFTMWQYFSSGTLKCESPNLEPENCPLKG